ncbi:MAG: pyrroline-5-carboxylate reductase [Bacteroidetes bacterium]|nr:pyrroline-5-carboxylate reductase [Bacteroidota bacterium]
MNKIAIIGGGNLGAAIANGLIKSQYIEAENLTITRRNLSSLESFRSLGVSITSDNQAAIENAHIVILAVKPYQIKEIVSAAKFRKDQIVISVVTGIWLKDLQEWIDEKPSLFRAMPNTAISIQQSMTCICSAPGNTENLNVVDEIFSRLGRVITIEETLMDAATVLGACGTAFAMRYIRASIQGGIQIGFSASQANFIVAQTVLGAADLLLTNKNHPEYEIDKVTTPKGCTIAGLNELEHQGFSSALIKGLVASYEKILK